MMPGGMPGLPPGAARPSLTPQQQAALLQQQQAQFAVMMQNPAFRAQLMQQQVRGRPAGARAARKVWSPLARCPCRPAALSLLLRIAAAAPVSSQQLAMAAAQGGGAAAAKPAAAAAKPAAAAAPAAAATPAVQAVQAIPARKPGAGKKRKADGRLAERGDLLIPDSQLFTQVGSGGDFGGRLAAAGLLCVATVALSKPMRQGLHEHQPGTQVLACRSDDRMLVA